MNFKNFTKYRYFKFVHHEPTDRVELYMKVNNQDDWAGKEEDRGFNIMKSYPNNSAVPNLLMPIPFEKTEMPEYAKFTKYMTSNQKTWWNNFEEDQIGTLGYRVALPEPEEFWFPKKQVEAPVLFQRNRTEIGIVPFQMEHQFVEDVVMDDIDFKVYSFGFCSVV